MSADLIFNALGWTLLHFVWQGLLIGALVAVALVALRGATPQLRYLAACSGLLACLLWPAAELGARLQGSLALSADTDYIDIVLKARGQDGASSWLELLQVNIEWVVALWALCAGAMALRMALGLLWVRRSVQMPATDGTWQARVDSMAARFGLARRVALRVSQTLDSPLTVGWLRPVILLPAALLTGMPPDLIEALLAHEMAHIRRFDYLVNLGQNLVEIVLFYHPVVWWISGQIRVEREQIADDLAARQLGEPRRLALALSELERLQFSGHHLAMAANGGDLLARVRRLLRPDTERMGWKSALPGLLLASACVAVAANAAAHAPGGKQEVHRRAPMADFSSCAKPLWPAGAIQAEHTGTVTLGFLISRDGKVVDAKLRRSSGHPDLDEAARVGIRKCRFKPGTVNGVAHSAWMQMQYVWTLE